VGIVHGGKARAPIARAPPKCRREPPVRKRSPLPCQRNPGYPPAPPSLRSPPEISPPLRPAVAPILLLTGLSLAGCCVAPAADARFHRFPSFESPLTTFETLRAALRADDPALEYRCFSREFRERNGLKGADTWRVARARVLQDHPEIRWVARARLGETRPEGPGRCAATASVLGRRFLLAFVREDFFEILLRDGSRIDEYLEGPLRDRLSVEGGRLRVEIDDPLLRDLPPDSIDRVLVGGEWKILDVGPDPSPGSNP
jgi:hypothetical protein